MKNAAQRTLANKMDIYSNGSRSPSYAGGESVISNTFCRSSTNNLIRMKGSGNRYETHKGSIYQPLKRNVTGKAGLRYQLKESNNRLRALQELDKRREEQLAKEIAALDIKRKQQDEETQRRINNKKMRLAETGPITINQHLIKGKTERDPQYRFLSLVKT